MKRMSPSSFVLVSILVLTANLHAATYFVRSGASGNGTSWASAWGSVSWSQLNAGDTVCIAGGTYSAQITTGKSGVSGSPIVVRRATATDSTCGSGTSGWNSSYDSQVVIGGLSLAHNFVTIDGAVPNGIRMALAPGDNSAVTVGAATNGVTLRYFEVSGPCTPSGCNQTGDGRSINLNHWNGSSYDLQNNMTIQYANLHGACTILWSAHSTNLIIEHSRLADSIDNTSGNPYCHPNVIATQDSTNVTFRYNEVTNWEVEGIMACPNGGCTSSWTIYGNIWHDPYGGGSVARVLEAQGNANGPYLLYNNTFVGIGFTVVNTANGGSFTSGSQGRNNIYWNSGGPGLPSDDYDLSSASLNQTHGNGNAANPFVNSSARTVAGYHLSAHTTSGLNLGSPYNTDYDGNARSTWDRGAVEFDGSATSPQPPTGLNAQVQ